MPVEPVTRETFHELLPITRPVAMPMVPSETWTDDEWQRIRLGFHSQSMDDRWNLLVEGHTWFAHRSWTGHGIFEATFVPADGGGMRIGSALVESDPERFRSSGPKSDLRILTRVVQIALR
ncbi:MAG TPA: hypothetical protein VGM75_37505 [Pseudonocardiaceae bacterium]